MPRPLYRAGWFACLAALLATLAIGARWPLVGDSVLMHYVVLLTGHGFAPYKDIAEMNLPLTYLSEGLAMRVFGAGAVGWRLYDGALVLAMVVLSWRLLRVRGAAAGVFAATLFAAVHLQDGIHMAGQRDLLVTVLEAVAGLALLRGYGFYGKATADGQVAADKHTARDSVQFFAAAVFGGCGVAAACIKPPALLFAGLGAAWVVWCLWRDGQRRAAVRWCVAAVAGATVPLLVCVGYLLHFGALLAFVHDLSGLIAYHASLERRSVGFLLGHVWSPVLVFLVLSAAAAVVQPRAPWSRVDTLCALGAAAGLVSYVVQGKGFPYQRYPFLLWVLLLCASRLCAIVAAPAIKRSPYGIRAEAMAQVALLSGAVLVLLFLVRATHFSRADPYAALCDDLRAQNAAALDGKLQCLDTAGPCIGALYEQRLTQSTGFLYDCYLLDGSNPVARQQRALFEREFTARPPELIVLTDSNCFTGPRTFDKYRGWPWMEQQLAGYRTVLESHPAQPLHLWSRPEMPYAYRILRRGGEPAKPLQAEIRNR